MEYLLYFGIAFASCLIGYAFAMSMKTADSKPQSDDGWPKEYCRPTRTILEEQQMNPVPPFKSASVPQESSGGTWDINH